MTDAPREQRLVFGEVAETYDRARPGYPPALVDDVISLARLDAGDRVLEVGCGTGKATVQFAARGLDMTCLEPSESMAAVARRNCERFPRVAIETGSFEEWRLERGAFRLLVSAQAWHWVSPEARLTKAYDTLAPGATLAVFWNTVEWRDAHMRAAVDDLYERLVPDLIARRPGFPGTRSTRQLSVQELDDSTLFESISSRQYPWSETYTTDSYLALLSTHSDHRMLSADAFQRLAEGLARLIDDSGGTLRVDYVTRLHVARRADPE
jgi:SAM-dependent methyltransferase